MATVLGLVFFFQMISFKLHLYDLIWYFDMPMHFAGGLFIGLLGFYLYLKNKDGKVENLTRMIYFVIIFALVIAFGWEVFEYVVAVTTRGSMLHLLDSFSDICFDLAGSSVAIIYTLFNIKDFFKK